MICPIMSAPIKVSKSAGLGYEWMIQHTKCLEDNCAWWDTVRESCSQGSQSRQLDLLCQLADSVSIALDHINTTLNEFGRF